MRAALPESPLQRMGLPGYSESLHGRLAYFTRSFTTADVICSYFETAGRMDEADALQCALALGGRKALIAWAAATPRFHWLLSKDISE